MSGLDPAAALLSMARGDMQARAREAADAGTAMQQHDREKDPALWEVSLKFEAMLLQQMMSAMRKTVPESGLLPSGFAGDMHSSMFDRAIAETGSKSGGMGIAENIYRQMSAADPGRIKENPESADITDTGGRSAGSKE